MSQMWIDKIVIGDLVIKKYEGLPGIVLGKEETARSRYGDIVNRRYKFKVYVSDGSCGWITETAFRALYKLP